MKRSHGVIFFWAILIISLTVVGLFDINISLGLQQSVPSIAFFFEVYGATPFFLVIMLLTYGFFNDNNSSHGKILHLSPSMYVPLAVGAFFCATLALGTMVLGYAFWGSVSSGFSYIFWTAPISLGITLFAWFLRKRLPLNIDRRGALLGVLFLLTILLVNQFLKALWGRVRPEDLESLADFTSWFKIQWFTGNASFPSGHVTLSLSPLALIFLIEKPRAKYQVFFATMAWGTGTAFGRIIEGAHYPTDVMFAMGITLFLFMIISWYGNRFLDRWIFPREDVTPHQEN